MATKGKKTLQKDSAYEEYDVDGDGVVSDAELATVKAIHEAEVAEEKADAQRKMAWFAMFGMLLYPFAVVLADLVGLDQEGEELLEL